MYDNSAIGPHKDNRGLYFRTQGKERYVNIFKLLKSGTFSFYKSIKTFYRAIYSVRVRISHYVLVL